MKYGKIVPGKLIRRVNRFMAEVFVNGTKEIVHIKNTGRLQELLQPGVEILLEYKSNPSRKTQFSLISVIKNDRWVNIDSQAPNTVVYEALQDGKMLEFGYVNEVKREVKYGNSRFDLSFKKDDQQCFIEVKGVTLEQNGVAMFPDAPTKRGTKHVLELVNAVQNGFDGVILFVVQMEGCMFFTPHKEMDWEFADALKFATSNGVKILAYDSIVNEDELILKGPIPVQL
ncbi:DNA/RNA nuclease SfsA [Calidifontibacillus erzurumensis]|uniref:Sugar fermentation stimulation protein homolog n=1 Tax=Calidifontibacillus erzurumensis TaxID=2741433 RepID=A0A8J8KCI5_9BACI|nr:DNA/RNA nuclease SfsA [Calidifontibacillus erzurumensis]NSL53109.1 DNA/RNA nuclease SfsA [Calidifontibacillus erzurumensis]